MKVLGLTRDNNLEKLGIGLGFRKMILSWVTKEGQGSLLASEVNDNEDEQVEKKEWEKLQIYLKDMNIVRMCKEVPNDLLAAANVKGSNKIETKLLSKVNRMHSKTS